MSSRLLTRSVRDSVSLLAGLAVAGVAAALLAFGATMPVISGAEPGFGSGPLLVVLALLPFAAALACVVGGRMTAAAGVLVGAAALAPGRAVLDLQFVVDPSVTTRPELYLATDLASPPPSVGLWLLLAGHAATVVAGVLAASAAGQAGSLVDEPGGRQATSADARWRQRWLLAVVFAGIVSAFGLLMAPVASEDPYLLARNAFEGPLVAMAGSLLLACAVPLTAALMMTSRGDGAFARGGLVGLAVSVAGMAVPNLVAGVSIEAAGASAGPVVTLAGGAGLLVVASTRQRPGGDDVEGKGGGTDAEDAGDRAGGVRVPGQGRLQVATGVLAMLTAAAAAAGAQAAQLSMPGDAPAPESPSRGLLLTAGLLVGFLGLGMLVPRLAPLVRPVLSVAWAGVLLAGTAVLDTAIAATNLPAAVSAGPGVLWTWLAMLAAAVVACCSVVTGVVERDNDNTTDRTGDDGGTPAAAGVNMLAPLAAAAVLAVAGFGTPVLTAPGFVAPGLWSNFGTPSWGLLVGLLTVLGALALAARSRPAHATGLLVGAACVLGLHAAAFPLSRSEIDGAAAGTGLWLTLAAVVAVVISAGVTVAGRRRS